MPLKRLLLGLFLFGACSSLPILPPEYQERAGSNASEEEALPWKIIALDVGQGDATLIIGPDKKALLIDGGPPESGLKILIPALKYYGVTRLEAIFATHYDADHIGGLMDLIPGQDQILGTEDDWIPQEGLYDRGTEDTEDLALYQWYAGVLGAYRHELTAGDQKDFGDCHIEIIAMNGIYSDGRKVSLDESENSRSMVLLLTLGDFRYLTMGDLPGGGETSVEKTMDLETHVGEMVGAVDLLHLSHHGSKTASNEGFLDLVTPEEALISAGRENDYGHPHAEVLGRLEKRGIDYRETKNGDIVIEIQMDGEKF